jgi:phage terminase large subunit-like protein
MFKRAQADTSGRWQTFHFTSRDNPHISTAALDEIAHDMTAVAYRMEILAEDVDEAPGALWKREHLDSSRLLQAPELKRIFVGVDPAGSVGGDATGIVTVGGVGDQLFVLADDTLNGTPLEWAKAAVTAYYRHNANGIVAEANFGGDMVLQTIRTVDSKVPVKLVTASRSKQVRAEPVAAVFEQKRGHLVGTFPALEDELVLWTPGDASPNRLDAMVWAATDLLSKRHYDKPGAVGY